MIDTQTTPPRCCMAPAVRQEPCAIATRQRHSLSNRGEVPIPELPVVVEQTVPAPKPLFPHPDPSWLGRTP